MITDYCRTKHQLSPSDEDFFFFCQAPTTNKYASHNPVKHQINKILRPLPSLTHSYTHSHTHPLTICFTSFPNEGNLPQISGWAEPQGTLCQSAGLGKSQLEGHDTLKFTVLLPQHMCWLVPAVWRDEEDGCHQNKLVHFLESATRKERLFYFFIYPSKQWGGATRTCWSTFWNQKLEKIKKVFYPSKQWGGFTITSWSTFWNWKNKLSLHYVCMTAHAAVWKHLHTQILTQHQANLGV